MLLEYPILPLGGGLESGLGIRLLAIGKNHSLQQGYCTLVSQSTLDLLA